MKKHQKHNRPRPSHGGTKLVVPASPLGPPAMAPNEIGADKSITRDAIAGVKGKLPVLKQLRHVTRPKP